MLMEAESALIWRDELNVLKDRLGPLSFAQSRGGNLELSGVSLSSPSPASSSVIHRVAASRRCHSIWITGVLLGVAQMVEVRNIGHRPLRIGSIEIMSSSFPTMIEVRRKLPSQCRFNEVEQIRLSKHQSGRLDVSGNRMRWRHI